MSLLAMIADNFELEPPDHDEVHFCPVDEEPNNFTLDDPVSNNDNGKSLSEPLLLSPQEGKPISAKREKSNETKLLLSFLLMLIFGTGNKIFQKLQAIPMYNYPNSLNLLQNFVYVPLCFAYIFPVQSFGLLGNAIPKEVSGMSKKPFAIMVSSDWDHLKALQSCL
jgi:hypothetical protein